MGRLADGVPLETARRELTGIARALKAEHGDDTWMVDAAVVPLRDSLVPARRASRVDPMSVLRDG